MIKAFKAFFLARQQREKFLLVVFIAVMLVSLSWAQGNAGS